MPAMPAEPADVAETVARFAVLDWAIVFGYLAVVVAIGSVFSRKKGEGDDFFLAGRTMPMWAVAISVLATSQSAATFVGGPEQSYGGNLTYLAANLGVFVAVVIAAVFFIPAYYRHNVTSVYELIGHRYGAESQRLASGMFMLGRVFASGARLFIVAIPFSLVAFGDTEPRSLVFAVTLIAIGATAYTLAGGIRAVIWTDVLQATVYIGTIAIALVLLWQKIPVGASEVVEALRTSPEGDKLVALETDFDLGEPYSIWAILTGVMLINLAAFGADQDLTQRMLTCRSPLKGSWSVVLSNIIGWPVVFLFLVMGLLLYVYYKRPDVMGDAAPDYAIEGTRKVFLEFILRETPAGLRGLMMAGLFAAAMSSMDSALNAMASTTVADFYRPWRRRREPAAPIGDRRERRVSRLAIAAWATALLAFAVGCVFWQQASGTKLIDFALGVMVFAYSGLLAVFATAIFTNRGNAWSVAASLVAGFVLVLLMQPIAWTWWAPPIGLPDNIVFSWRMTIATSLCFIICCLGRRRAAIRTYPRTPSPPGRKPG